MKEGIITRISGPVIDVLFEDALPKIKEALIVRGVGKKKVMEVCPLEILAVTEQ